MGVGYLNLASANTDIIPDSFLLDPNACLYNKYNNTPYSTISGEGLIIINSVTNVAITEYTLTLARYSPGTVFTIVNKIPDIEVTIQGLNKVPVTTLAGVDMCKVVAGDDCWGVLFNQAVNPSLPNGYIYGTVRFTDLPTKPAGFLPIDPNYSGLTTKNLKVNLNTNGTILITNPGIVFQGCIQLEFSPDIQGFGPGNTDQRFVYIIATNPPSLISNVHKAIWQNSYGFTSNSMIALIDMARMASISIQISRTDFTDRVFLAPSDLIITTLPVALKEIEGNVVPQEYNPIVPFMTSNTTPVPFVVLASSEFTPGWYAFNPTQVAGWVANTTDPADSPDISIQFDIDTTVSKSVNLITLESLDLSPTNMLMDIYVYGDYYSNGLRFTDLIATVNNFSGYEDGSSKQYKLYLNNSYNIITFIVYDFAGATGVKPGIKNIQVYTNEGIITGMGGTSTGIIPSNVISLNSGKYQIPTSFEIPPFNLRQKYYFNTIPSNTFDYDYNPVSSTFDITNSDNIELTKYLGYNGPDTLNGLGLYDYNLIVGKYRCLYKSLQTFAYSSQFKLAPTKLTYVVTDVIPFSLDTPASSNELAITLAQNGEIVVFTNKTNRVLIVDVYLPICFSPLVAGTTPTLSLFVNLVSQPFKIRANTYSNNPSSAMITNLYDSFTVAANGFTTMQVQVDVGSADIKLQTIDPSYYLGFFTIY